MFQVASRQGVHNIMPKAAALVKKYRDSSLTGRPAFYDENARSQRSRVGGLRARARLTYIRKEMDAAWTAKDFDRLVELLQPVHSDLTKVESKRWPTPRSTEDLRRT